MPEASRAAKSCFSYFRDIGQEISNPLPAILLPMTL
jgi:hypothetical protein